MTLLILILLRLWTGKRLQIYIVIETLSRYFLPSHNPDGYAYTRDNNRMWRKTRSDNGGIFGCKVGSLKILTSEKRYLNLGC